MHAPSEHTINGASWPLEVHFVHNTNGTVRLVEEAPAALAAASAARCCDAPATLLLRRSLCAVDTAVASLPCWSLVPLPIHPPPRKTAQ